ncbi:MULTISPECIES: cytochrome c biogenesis protein CcsA [Pyrobaculum]|uniref:Cytochrome c biogenesis protein CcsA n=1 Tax=Pyrobaculum arsenaticum TaxID=121277 RepID=A0A7L4P9S9_9CREN|nr:cytochrome c biogenesis protein CcsA [Pyrobaculum arsenaticum]MCY0890599.1 cytochrome c biogenesis protein CcsA [Pyrobaculum arsenaticum]NYR14890.1 cytochrome c biogenesis protein CcsA [Pyrobaculum arsenaticum]
MDVPYLALLAAAAALSAASAWRVKLGPAALGALAVLAGYHYAAYFAGRFDLVIVYINAALGQSLLERAAGALATIPGAVLTMVLPLAVAGVWARSRWPFAAAALLLLYAAAEKPFATVDDVFPGYGPASGMGLNPLLRSIWAVPHPVAVLAGYGLLLGGALARRLDIFKWGWWLTSLGLLLGALWSYETFGWAGYWAWDPVENALLAVWLAATAAIHLKSWGAQLATAGILLGAVALNQGGFSALHSFVGSTPTPQILLFASAALTVLGLLRIAVPKDLGLGVAAGGMLATALVIYVVNAAPALYSVTTGASIAPPAGDVFVAWLLLPLASAVYAGTAVMSIYYAGVGKWKYIVALYALYIFVAAAVAWVYKYASESPTSTNFFIYLLWMGSATAAYYVAKSRHSPLHKALHVATLLLLIFIAASGPYAYSQSYYKLLAVDSIGARYFTLLPWPYPQSISVEKVEVAPDGRVVEIPPNAPLRNPPNYSAFVEKVGGRFTLDGLNYTVVDAGGVKYVVVWGGGQRLGSVGEVPVVRVERNGTAVIFPAPLDLVEALSENPAAVEQYLRCHGNNSALVPGGFIINAVLTADGNEVPLSLRFDVSGVLKGVGAVAIGVGHFEGLVGQTVLLLPPSSLEIGGPAWDLATALYVKTLMEQCNPRAALFIIERMGGRGLADLARYLHQGGSVWVVAFKPVPAVTLVWTTSAAVLVISFLMIKRPEER